LKASLLPCFIRVSCQRILWWTIWHMEDLFISYIIASSIFISL